jgi:DNA-binding NarL/FixJ family response regulator
LLSSHLDFEIVGEAGDGLEAIRAVDRVQPNLILMDLSMPRMDGIAAIREIKKKWPKIHVLALTVHKTEEYIMATLGSGADGYILKDTTHAELLEAIRIILSGKRVLSPSISEKVIEGCLDGKRKAPLKSSWDTLTRREREILKLIGEGNRNKKIAEFLCISPKTVEKHRANIMDKLNLHNASVLTAYAIEKGLITK